MKTTNYSSNNYYSRMIKREFMKYEEARQSGKYNMVMDMNKVVNEYGIVDYHTYMYILDNYSDDASFDGLPVKIFDNSLCPIDAEGTITVTPTVQGVTVTKDTDYTVNYVRVGGTGEGVNPKEAGTYKVLIKVGDTYEY